MAFRLESERLVIRGFEDSDLPAFRRIATDPRVVRTIGDGRPWSDARILELWREQREHAKRHGLCLGALICRASSDLIGLAGAQPLGATAEFEIGWWLEPGRWGLGLATEAAREVVRFAFHEADLARVVAIAHPGNLRSIRVMERLGMRFERLARGVELGLRQPEVEVVLYGLSRKLAGRGGG